jgi:AraC family transcriptional regulator
MKWKDMNQSNDQHDRAPLQPLSRSCNKVERSVDFPTGLVEIRSFDWSYDEIDIHRLRPDKYVFGLSLAGSGTNLRVIPAVGSSDVRSARRNQITVIPPGRKVSRNLVHGLHRSLFCLIDSERIDGLVPSHLQERVNNPLGLVARSAFRLEWLLRNIYDEMRQDLPGRATIIESFANALVVEFARSVQVPKDDLTRRKGGLAPWRLRLLQQRVESDAAMPALAELADLCGLTVRHLCRAFKVETGQTPGEYVEAAMARHAQRMLSETLLPLSEIADQLGFATSSSFSHAFQRATGLKPRQIERPAKYPGN